MKIDLVVVSEAGRSIFKATEHLSSTDVTLRLKRNAENAFVSFFETNTPPENDGELGDRFAEIPYSKIQSNNRIRSVSKTNKKC